MLNTKEIYNQLKDHWTETQAKLIIHALTDDLIVDKVILKKHRRSSSRDSSDELGASI